jgi:hypothetical protein
VPLHLRAENEIGLQLGNFCLHFQIVIGDEGRNTIALGGFAYLTREFTAVRSETDD